MKRNERGFLKVLSRFWCCVTIDGVYSLDDWIYCTCTHHTELHLIIMLSLIYTLYKLQGHAKSSQSSLVVSCKRMYDSLTVNAAHIKSSFHSRTFNSQQNSFDSCQRPTISSPSLHNYLRRAQLSIPIPK
jgi:hypothetical protein